LYADVQLPVFQDFRGNQIAAAALVKVILSYGAQTCALPFF
jgi:hypothetical protein